MQHVGRVEALAGPAVCSGQPSVENGHSPEENQVSSTSVVLAPARAGGGSLVAGRRTTVSPSGPYQTGMRWPHQSWREMHQSRMLSIQSKYAALQLLRVDLHPAVAHRVAGRLGQRLDVARTTGATGAARRSCRSASQWPTECMYGASRSTMRPCSRSAATTAARASRRSRPQERAGAR